MSTLQELIAKSRDANPSCGCEFRGRRWFVCQYHQGLEDGFEEAEDRIRELEAELLKPAMLEGVAYVPEEKLKVAYQRIARAREILKEYLKETNYFYSGSKVRTPMEDRMAKALDALEGI